MTNKIISYQQSNEILPAHQIWVVDYYTWKVDTKTWTKKMPENGR